MPTLKPAWFQATASASLIGLIFLCLAWELWLAPLRPGGSWLVLKTLPLLVPLFGILNGRLHSYRWVSLLVWPYVAEGVVRVMTEPSPASTLASLEIVLAMTLFLAASGYIRITLAARRG